MSKFRPDWEAWEVLIREKGVELDRPAGTTHPTYPEIIYPIDYGYIPETKGTDGDELDIFVGSAETGLVAVILTVDIRKNDRECKLLYNCSPSEIYLVNGFINFDRSKMYGELIMRQPMRSLFETG